MEYVARKVIVSREWEKLKLFGHRIENGKMPHTLARVHPYSCHRTTQSSKREWEKNVWKKIKLANQDLSEKDFFCIYSAVVVAECDEC